MKELILPDVPNRLISKEEKGFDRLAISIERFEKEEIKEGCIMFYGSSGFTRWTDKNPKWAHPTPLSDAILSKTGEKVCVNHGFGSSTTHELCYYYDRAVRPWKPKAMVVTCYINDFGFGYTNEEIAKCCDWLISQAREDFPAIKLYFTDVRPRAKSFDEKAVARYLELNAMIRDVLKKYPDTHFIEMSKWDYFYNDPKDVGTYLNVNEKMFVEDKTHYTEEGYAHFAEELKKVLDDVL